MSSEPKAPSVPKAVLDAVVNAYYPQVLAEAEAARRRAQNGYAIAGAIAAALTAAGVLGDLGRQPLAVQLVGCAALAAWLGCALLFLRAVTTPTESVGADSAESSTSAGAFVTVVLDHVDEERDAIVARTRWATRVAFVAIALTFAAIVMGSTIDDDGHDVVGRLVLTSSGRAAMVAACDTPAESVTAILDEHALDQATVRLRLPSGCGGQRPATMFLPRSAVASFVADQIP